MYMYTYTLLVYFTEKERKERKRKKEWRLFLSFFQNDIYVFSSSCSIVFFSFLYKYMLHFYDTKNLFSLYLFVLHKNKLCLQSQKALTFYCTYILYNQSNIRINKASIVECWEVKNSIDFVIKAFYKNILPSAYYLANKLYATLSVKLSKIQWICYIIYTVSIRI